MDPAVTHRYLVDRAARWLRNTAGCGVVMIDPIGCMECPDAIGWKRAGRESILIECKATRSDFFADRHKSFRRPGARALGVKRYYFTPPGLVRPDELLPGWGLLECLAKRCKRVVSPERFPENQRDIP